MNYQHAFHAGNFADVHKHVVLTRILEHLRGKPAAFRVIDSHAGAGRYDLLGPEATRTFEWHDGIGRVFARRPDGGNRVTDSSSPQALLAPYLDIIAALNPAGGLRVYPGSPLVAKALLRPQDRLIACELEPPRQSIAYGGAARRAARQSVGARRLDGAERQCAAEGAPRRRSDRSALRGRRRFHAAFGCAPGGASQMADRDLSVVVPDQGTAGARRAGRGGSSGLVCRRCCAAKSRCGRRAPMVAWRDRVLSPSIRLSGYPRSCKSCCRRSAACSQPPPPTGSTG